MRKAFHGVWESIFDYLQTLLEELARLLAATVGTALLNCIWIYGGWYMWKVLMSTYSGKVFEEGNPETAALIKEFFSILPYWQTAAELAVASMLFTLAVALVCQFIYLRHLLYSTLWGPLKLVWPVALSFALAWLLQRYDASLSSYASYVIILLPSMVCVIFPAMKSAQRIMPDIGTLILAIFARF